MATTMRAIKNEGTSRFDVLHPIRVVIDGKQSIAVTRDEARALMASLGEALKAGRKFREGQRVTFNGGFPGTVVRYYSENMIEVRGERGMVCIDEADANTMEGEV